MPKGNFKKEDLQSLPVEFSYSKKISNLISSFKVRVMYAGPNRNGSYFSEETMKKMAETLRGIPVVGHYSDELEDFQGHGDLLIGEAGNTVVGIEAYGFIPTDTNIYSETNIDKDGISREYMVVDAYLWTGRYPELEVVKQGKSNQSMELNPMTMEFGDFKKVEDKNYMEITNAEFNGLCILGQDVEPCFEGAGVDVMFSNSSLYDSLEKMETELTLDLHSYSLEDKGQEVGDMTKEEEVVEEVKVEEDKVEKSKVGEALAENLEDETVEEVVEEETEEVEEEAEVEEEEETVEEVEETEEAEETEEDTEVEEEEETVEEDDEEVEEPTDEDIEAVEEVEVTEDIEELEKELTEAEKLAEIEADYKETVEAKEISIKDLEKEAFEALKELKEYEDKYAVVLAENEELKESLKEYQEVEELEAKENVLDSYKDTISTDTYEDYAAKLSDYSTKDLEDNLIKDGYNFLKNLRNRSTGDAPSGRGTGSKFEKDELASGLSKALEQRESTK